MRNRGVIPLPTPALFDLVARGGYRIMPTDIIAHWNAQAATEAAEELTVSWTWGYSPRRLPISWIGPRSLVAIYSWASSDSRCIHEEDSTRLGDQDKDSSPPTYSTRTLAILGLWYII